MSSLKPSQCVQHGHLVLGWATHAAGNNQPWAKPPQNTRWDGAVWASTSFCPAAKAQAGVRILDCPLKGLWIRVGRVAGKAQQALTSLSLINPGVVPPRSCPRYSCAGKYTGTGRQRQTAMEHGTAQTVPGLGTALPTGLWVSYIHALKGPWLLQSQPLDPSTGSVRLS